MNKSSASASLGQGNTTLLEEVFLCVGELYQIIGKMVVVVSFMFFIYFLSINRKSLEGQFRHKITVRVLHFFFSDISVFDG